MMTQCKDSGGGSSSHLCEPPQVLSTNTCYAFQITIVKIKNVHQRRRLALSLVYWYMNLQLSFVPSLLANKRISGQVAGEAALKARDAKNTLDICEGELYIN